MPNALLISRQTSRPHWSDLLAEEGFTLERAPDGRRALELMGLAEPDIVLIDMAGPPAGVWSLCSDIRRFYDTPIVVLSSDPREHDIVRALESGADDYIAMPIRPVELLARVRAVLRRTGEGSARRLSGDRIVAGDIELRLDEHRAYRHGSPLNLSPIEFKLLALLMKEAGRAVSHAKLIAHVWGPEYADCRHYLRLYIRYLRAKIEKDPRNPQLILNEWGVGYRFEPSRAAS
jgi:two-component system KDP operon response regulator KdpE